MVRRLIGCGAWHRGDDAAGLLVASALRERGIEAIEHTGDGLDLIETWKGADEVVLVDAVVTGAPAGTISKWDLDAPVATEPARASSHAFGVAEAIRLARELGRLPPKFTLYGIEARQFELGAGPSPEVAAAARKLATVI